MFALSFLLALCVALACGWLIYRYDRLHSWATHDNVDAGPQKFHIHPTPRIGGLALAGGFFAAILMLVMADGGGTSNHPLWLFALACLPAFMSGFIEDLTKRMGPDIRLWSSFLSALLAMLFFDVVVDDVGFSWANQFLSWYPAAVIFTVIAVGGIAHAMNIIDGFNGLAGMVSIIILASIAWVAWLVGDQAIGMLSLSLAGGTLGFLYWNWPRPRMFIGDGGAYLLGVSIGILSLMLVSRNAAVSPWFAMLIVSYPVTETLFTIYRRKILHRTASGLPDARHLHQLIYRRVLGAAFLPKSDPRRGWLNSATSPFLWCLTMASVLPAVLFWNKTGWLVVFTLIFVITYVWIYRAIVTFQVPCWICRLARLLARAVC